MAKPDTSAYRTFDQITDRLDDIVSQVRGKDISLEHSLDLFDEAIALGSKAVEMVDTTEFTPEEEARLIDSKKTPEAPADSGKKPGDTQADTQADDASQESAASTESAEL